VAARGARVVTGIARRVLSGILAGALAVGPLAGGLRAQGAMTRADYEACQVGDEAGFRAAIEAITVKALQKGLAGIDFPAIVAEEWRRAGLDDIIDKRVDISVAEVKDQSSWGTLLQSLANREKAQQLATAVAERVYRSDAVKTGLETLAENVGKSLGRQIEIATIDAAQPAMQCLQAFLGPRYGSTVARAVSATADKEFLDPSKSATAPIGTGSVLAEGGEGIAGAVVLMVRRQLANMASRIGQRLVGSVLSRLVSVAAGGVGLVLIAKEMWDLRHGVMPIISNEMKSRDTKDKVREELARTLSEQIGDHVREIGAKTAERIADVWRDFRRAHAQVLDLAERNEGFRKFVDTTRPDLLPRLDEMVALVLAEESEAGVLRRLADGTLHQIVNVVPMPGVQIAREVRSVEVALKWVALADASLPRVIEHELHRRARPETFSKASLARILSVDDRIAVTRLASLTPSARETLFEISANDLRALGRALTEGELDTLASYLTGLSSGPRERILKAVAQNPGRMQVLASSRVRDAIIGSQDQAAAVAMMLRADSGFDPQRLQEDVRLVLDGKVKPVLMWDRHPVAVYGAGVLLLLVLLILRRLFSSGKPRIRTAKPEA
jgi:hypothetical protein